MKKFLTISFLSLSICASAYAETTWNDLSNKIKDALNSADLGRHSIETDYKSEGELRITGYVSSEADLKLVEDKLSGLPGVKTVKNELTVRSEVARSPSEAEKRLNDKVHAAVQSALKTVRYELTIDNNNGNLILKGEASDQAAIEKIGAVAKSVQGVKNVTNLLKVSPPPSDPELVNRIKTAFAAENNLQAEDITIEAKDGVVTLAGSKRSHRVVDRILSIVQMVDGVKKIISNIGVEK